MEIQQIDFKMKIDLQGSLLALKEGESRAIPNKYVKPSGVRSSIKWLNQKDILSPAPKMDALIT